MPRVPGIAFLVFIVLSVKAGTVQEGGLCSTTHDHLDPFTHKFLSQCTDLTFCSTSESNSASDAASNGINGTCTPRLCRRDEFPFGYGPNDVLPPLCLQGTYCPDEGSGCREVLPPGSTCQLGRDEQCGSISGAPEDAWREEQVFQIDERGISDEVLCLLSTCAIANVTFGQPCVSDNTTYADFGPDGSLINYNIYRDNCRSSTLFCDPVSRQCERKKSLGEQCGFDMECESFNCMQSICTRSPETPYHVAPWQYSVTFLCIVGTMIATFVILMLVHGRHRARRYKELREYYAEQIRLRRAIIALHSVAADTMLDM